MAAGATLMGAAACTSSEKLVNDAGTNKQRDGMVDFRGVVLYYGAPLPLGTGGNTGTGGVSGTGGAAGSSADAGRPDASDAAAGTGGTGARDAAEDGRSFVAIYGAPISTPGNGE
jgi:hypothetical protein